MQQLHITILHFASLRVFGGAEIYLLRLAEHLQHLGCRIRILSPRATLGEPLRIPARDAARLAQLDYHELSARTVPFLHKPAWFHTKDLRRWLQDTDVLYHSHFYGTTTQVNTVRPSDLPCCLALLNPLTRPSRTNPLDLAHHVYNRVLLRRDLVPAQALHTVNGTDEQALAALGLPGVFHLPLPINVAEFPYKPLGAKPSSGFRLLFAGRLTRQKGLHTLITALRLLDEAANGGPPYELAIYGTGPLAPLARRLASERPHVTYTGFHAPPLTPAYHDAHLLVMPSEYESYGFTLLEALACGTPVVASNVAGLRDHVRAGGGWLVAPRDAVGLARRIRSARELWRKDPQAYQALSRRGVRHAMRHDYSTFLPSFVGRLLSLSVGS